MLFRHAPKRHQPGWSWLAFGAAVSVVLLLVVTVGLDLMFRLSSTFGSTYGPLAGIVALMLWALAASISFLYGAALSAQLEAVRAGATAPQDVETDARGRRRTRATDRPMSAPRSDRTLTVRRTLEGIIGVPMTEGNEISIMRNGDEIFPVMLEAIAGARHTIDFLTFVYWSGDIGTRFADALSERARAGVRVRVLLDGWGSHPIERPLVDEMQEAGVQVRWFRPLKHFEPNKMDHRTHRKVLIVDETAGFTGGVGIADEWQGNARDVSEWRDTHFRVSGPAVDGLRAAFLDNWAETDDVLFDTAIDRFPLQEQPGSSVIQCVRGASEAGMSDISTLFYALLQLAEERVRITTAYFVPDEAMTKRLCDAADRGVAVEILLPGPNADKRFVQLAGEAAFTELLDHGDPHLELPALDAARQGDDRRRRCSPRWARPTSTRARPSSMRRSTSSCSTPTSWRRSTNTSTTTWNAATRCRPARGRTGRSRSASWSG